MIKNKAIWLFGLSGAGKTTLARQISETYEKQNIRTIVLDGDILRNGINKGLGFSREDRSENVRRIAEICKLMLQVDIVPIVAAITPYESDRIAVKKTIGENKLVLVHVKCSIDICEARDPKGLYAQVRKGTIKNFTGITDTYEGTNVASITINTERDSIDASINGLLECLSNKIEI
ncbi:adenylyl-sulfate kinase [Snuella lapsa]|uniref:Adenylyl-sulfate kinase n=1 Tax=Snuella lapsa TaxID=870481 RepID=A0ABP6XMG2_9FLAO